MSWLEDGNAHRKVKADVDLVAPCDMPDKWSVRLRFAETSLTFEVSPDSLILAKPGP